MDSHYFGEIGDLSVLSDLALWCKLSVWQLHLFELFFRIRLYGVLDLVDVRLSFCFEFIRCGSCKFLLICLESMNETAFFALEVFDIFGLEHLIKTSAECRRADLRNAQCQ